MYVKEEYVKKRRILIAKRVCFRYTSTTLKIYQGANIPEEEKKKKRLPRKTWLKERLFLKKDLGKRYNKRERRRKSEKKRKRRKAENPV